MVDILREVNRFSEQKSVLEPRSVNLATDGIPGISLLSSTARRSAMPYRIDIINKFVLRTVFLPFSTIYFVKVPAAQLQ